VKTKVCPVITFIVSNTPVADHRVGQRSRLSVVGTWSGTVSLVIHALSLAKRHP